MGCVALSATRKNEFTQVLSADVVSELKRTRRKVTGG